MTIQIQMPPEWEQLSPEERELSQKWIQSILQAVESSKNLLNLLNNNQHDFEFIESSKEISIQQYDIQIITYTTASETQNPIDIMKVSCDIVCQADPDSEACKTCLKNNPPNK